MTVPNVAEWQREPGFTTGPCCCVVTVGKPWPDCSGCGGSGVTGLVPIGVWQVARWKRAMPEYRGDPRFDPRALASMRLDAGPEAVQAADFPLWAWAAGVAAGVAALLAAAVVVRGV